MNSILAGRPAALAVSAVGLALISLTGGFGAVDLVSPWVLHEGTQVTDVGYGTLAGLVIPIGLLTQTRSPESTPPACNRSRPQPSPFSSPERLQANNRCSPRRQWSRSQPLPSRRSIPGVARS
jgi:hypothetical protein